MLKAARGQSAVVQSDESQALVGLEAERDHGDAGGAQGRGGVAHVEHPRQHGATLFRAVRGAVGAVQLTGRDPAHRGRSFSVVGC